MALAVTYPKGKKGGSQFWPQPWGNVSRDGALSSGAQPRSAVLSYQVAFPEEWDFIKGGKLPGLVSFASIRRAPRLLRRLVCSLTSPLPPQYGGADTGQCTGGDRQLSCFSARLMWRPRGAGEVYAYSPQYKVR